MTPATAEPLIIQSGNFGFSGGDPASFRFIGQDFSLNGILFRGFPDFGPLRTCPYGVGCELGTAVDFSAAYTGPVVGWNIFQAPPQFPAPDSTSVLYTIDMQVSGPTVTVPTATDAITRVMAPFTFAGTLTANAIVGSYDDYELGPLLFTTALFGGGNAELVLNSWHCSQTSAGGFDCTVAPPYDPAALSYEFTATPAPVPEPATLLLLGAGAAGVLTRRRSRR